MRWIEALDLERWAGQIDARVKMPELVADLIRATLKQAPQLRFPSGDLGETPGFDGHLVARSESPFVPDGKSIWEFGSSASGKAKAEADYKKRTEETDPAERALHTLVIVSPRAWRSRTKLPEWIKAKNDLKQWDRVEYLDSPRLQDWLEQCPAVASKWAREMGRAPKQGAQCIAEFWQGYSTRFAPPLIEEVLLAGRKTQAEELLKNLIHENGLYAYAADSCDEVIAFAIAAIRTAPEPLRKSLEARTLILETDEAARFFVNTPNLVYLPRLGGRLQAGQLARLGPTVVSINAAEKSNKHVLLPRPSSMALGKAFAGMEMDVAAGYRIASACGRSLAVLERQHPGGVPEAPEWAKDPESLLPGVLAGAWIANQEPDCDILSILAGTGYDAAEDQLCRFTRMRDAPIECLDALWALRAPVDAFVHVGDRIRRQQLARFETALTKVFSKAAEPRQPQNADVALGVARYGEIRHAHSQPLKNGLATTLLLMAVMHKQAHFTVVGESPAAYVEKILSRLLGLSDGHHLLASMERQLPLLAEAAPEAFLATIERLLEGDAASIKPIFNEYPGLITSTDHLCGLLWALEVLAWLPDFFQRAALCLAKLASLEPEGRSGNRPLGSLRSIFLSWTPGTAVPTQHRLAVLENLLKDAPSIAWPLLEQLLPREGDTCINSASPKFREYEQAEALPLTDELVSQSEARIVSLAIDHASFDPERWSKIIRGATHDRAALEDVVVRIQEALQAESSQQHKLAVWKVLRREVALHRRHHDVDWAMPLAYLCRLEELIEIHKPMDLLESISWLFDEWHPQGIKDDAATPTQGLERARVQALTQVLDFAGVTGLLMLLEMVKEPYTALSSLAGLQLPYDQLLEIFHRLVSSTGSQMIMAGSILGDGIRRFGGKWASEAGTLLKQNNQTPEMIASVLLEYVETNGDWDYLASFGQDVDQHYWRQRCPKQNISELDSVVFAVERYCSVGRFCAALFEVSNQIAVLPIETINALMTSAVTEHNANPEVGLAHLDIDELFAKLAQRPDLSPVQLARLEYMYAPLMRNKPRTLKALMLENPEDFVQILCEAFTPRGAPLSVRSHEDHQKAQAAYELLRALKTLPGQQGLDVDAAALMTWCVGARRLGQDAEILKDTDHMIGRMLAHAPVSIIDSAWPHDAVREVIEAMKSPDLEDAIWIERVRMNSTRTKTIEEGGGLERELARQTREWATAASASLRTSAMLRQIAKYWEEDAEREAIYGAQRALFGEV